jgi:hypothetical protein
MDNLREQFKFTTEQIGEEIKKFLG